MPGCTIEGSNGLCGFPSPGEALGQYSKNYLAAVRHSQISAGLGDPNIGDMPCLDYVVKGLKRLATNPQRPRLPITPEILKRLRTVWETLPSQHDAAMLWAAATMCFFDFLRVGEVVSPSDSGFDPEWHLTYEDVRQYGRPCPQPATIAQSTQDIASASGRLRQRPNGASRTPSSKR